jgi:hypothetical protein
MIKLGMLDFDTSHAIEFARRLNHRGVGEDQWVEGARVVVACPGESLIMPERIPGYQREIADLGIPLVDRPEEMLGRVDGMLIESQEGGAHYARARPFLEAGLPCFIDKPFTCGVADAWRLVDLAERKGVPIFSASSLRFAPGLVQLVTDQGGTPILGALAYSPGHLQPRNPGLYHYGIHAVEILYTLLGPGCINVSCLTDERADVATGRWPGGRLGTVHSIRNGKSDYGCLVFSEQGVRALPIDTTYIYRELLKQVVHMFATGRSPLDIRETVAIVAFIEAAGRSALQNGATEAIRA